MCGSQYQLDRRGKPRLKESGGNNAVSGCHDIPWGREVSKGKQGGYLCETETKSLGLEKKRGRRTGDGEQLEL